MRKKTNIFLGAVAMAFLAALTCHAGTSKEGNAKIERVIVTSDTILSGMIASLLPPDRYSTEAILPPGQCPGHYDVKLSDIEKMKVADLIVSFKGMPFMAKAGPGGKAQFLVDAGDRNWMAPHSYIYGLGVLADALSKIFPKDHHEIVRRKEDSIREVKAGTDLLLKEIKRSGFFGKPVLASSMQKEPLEWMGFIVVGEYGRQEAISARELVRLMEIGKVGKPILVVDNLQSGPDAGKGIAETLGVPHVVLTNFPSEKGYLATLTENINTLLAAAKRK
jgi:zinc transport system substrate-binding protein